MPALPADFVFFNQFCFRFISNFQFHAIREYAKFIGTQGRCFSYGVATFSHICATMFTFYFATSEAYLYDKWFSRYTILYMGYMGYFVLYTKRIKTSSYVKPVYQIRNVHILYLAFHTGLGPSTISPVSGNWIAIWST